jgi:transaldolase
LKERWFHASLVVSPAPWLIDGGRPERVELLDQRSSAKSQSAATAGMNVSNLSAQGIRAYGVVSRPNDAGRVANRSEATHFASFRAPPLPRVPPYPASTRFLGKTIVLVTAGNLCPVVTLVPDCAVWYGRQTGRTYSNCPEADASSCLEMNTERTEPRDRRAAEVDSRKMKGICDMPTPLQSLIACGTKLWLDSIDPELVLSNRQWGATGATSNPIIVADLIKTGRFDRQLEQLVERGLDDEALAWGLTDQLVTAAQKVFLPVWESTRANDGYVSFELDPLLEDPQSGPPHDERVARYIELGRKWSEGRPNRMIKVPATPAGLGALEELAASGVPLNVTLVFSSRQYQLARDAIWRGAQRLPSLDRFKSVYSIFVSRLDVYTQQAVPELSPDAQGLVGIVNAKRIWQENRDFWSRNQAPLQQEIVFASTGTKNPQDVPWKYVDAFAGSDIQTNPPATKEAVAKSGRTFQRNVDQFPPAEVLAEIDRCLDFDQLEKVLMEEGIQKFADPQYALLKLIAAKRQVLASS